MKLLEVATIDELNPSHVTQLATMQPIAKPVANAAAEAQSKTPRTVPANKKSPAKAKA